MIDIWYITDQKPGHLNQLRGLSNRLQTHAPLNNLTLRERWLVASNYSVSWSDYLFKRQPISAKTSPDIVIGAGHQTHKQVLIVGRRYNCFTTILMRPSLPLLWFDAAIVPEHDNPPNRVNVLSTKGVLNTIEPSANGDHSENQPGLMLIGGDSPHYQWRNESIVDQIVAVAHRDPHKKWTLTDSRRTPKSFAECLKRHKLTNVSFMQHTDTHPHWVAENMRDCSEVWVTPDSVSMVYEAITSGRPTRLFDLNNSSRNRITQGIETLIDSGLVTHYQGWLDQKESKSTNKLLWEADRAAAWLLDLYRKQRAK